MAEQTLGLLGVLLARLLLARRVRCQVISDAPGVQNQLIHKLRDLPRSGCWKEPRGGVLPPGGAWGRTEEGEGEGEEAVSFPPTSAGQPLGPQA